MVVVKVGQLAEECPKDLPDLNKIGLIKVMFHL